MYMYGLKTLDMDNYWYILYNTYLIQESKQVKLFISRKLPTKFDARFEDRRSN